MCLHVFMVSVKNYKCIRVYSSYRNEKGQPRSRVIENHGRLDAALKIDPQYLEKLKQRIAEKIKAQNLEMQAQKESINQLSR